MKNIHVLPTDKPSRLCKEKFGKFYLTELMESKISFFKNQNIYITNDEKIKDGDWAITNNNGLLVKVITELTWHFINSKKIILTTDQDLIKNGIQAINDEFLEWYVKNPSCEEVEVEPDYDEIRGDYYKIIIPKEEPKQETLEEAAENYVKEKWEYAADENKESFINGAKWQQERSYNKEEVKQAYVEGGFALMRYNDGLKYIDVNDWFKQFKKEVRL